MRKTINVVFEGCCHGELNNIYRAIEQRMGTDVDLVVIGGDFQAIRNEQDMNCISMPPKYRKLGDFHDYYHGRKKAPYLTIFVGGNHEASNYLQELYYGGWVAPNIYYLGAAGVINFNGLRIGGLSGIFKPSDYNLNHFERLPFDMRTERSVYHIRKFDVLKLALLDGRIDVMLSHDWPAGIVHHGDLPQLLRAKPFFKRDIDTGTLGSPPAMDLLKSLRPAYWWSAHLHVRFTALVEHSPQVELETKNPDEIELDLGGTDDKGAESDTRNPDEIELDLGDTDDKGPISDHNDTHHVDEHSSKSNPDEIALDIEVASNYETQAGDGNPPEPPVELPTSTHFLALDKCLPRRNFIELVPVEVDVPAKRKRVHEEPTLAYDPQWLAITRVMHRYFNTTRPSSPMPLNTELPDLKKQVDAELKWVQANIVDKDLLTIPANFVPQVPTADSLPANVDRRRWASQQPPKYTNPQTTAFCDLIQIDNRL